MFWQLQLYAETAFNLLFSATGLNLLFAALCLFAAFGMCPRRFALLSAVLYVLLAFC